MRAPTPLAEQYAWHANALKGVYGDYEGITEDPQCGWFKRRLVTGGPFVPARIWLYQDIDPETVELLSDEILQAEVGGNYADPMHEWPWLCANPISEAEFNYLMAVRDWAAWHAPDQPQANPRQPIDWQRVALPQFSQRSAEA